MSKDSFRVVESEIGSGGSVFCRYDSLCLSF